MLKFIEVDNSDGTIYVMCGAFPIGGSRTVTLTVSKPKQDGYEAAKATLTVKLYGHKLKSIAAKSATCQKTGTKAHKTCTECKEVFNQNNVQMNPKAFMTSKLSHSYVKNTTSKYAKVKATCTKGGKYYYSCKSCGRKNKSKVYSVNSFGHNYKRIVTKATVAKDGAYYSKCSRCGKKTSTTKILKASKISITASKVAYTDDMTENSAVIPVNVRNSKGKAISKSDYTLTYTNDFKTGVGKVKVSLKGDYNGSKTFTYTITGCPNS